MSRVVRDEPHKTAIYSTAVTAFFAIAGIAVVDPILPVIGQKLGASTWQIELLFTAYIAVMAIGMIPAVVATGRVGYKAVLVAGVSTVAVAAVLASTAGGIVPLALLRGLWGLGNAMFFATAMSLLVALARDSEWVVELFETCVGLGFAVGPLLGGLFGQISWRAPFLVCGVLMVVAVVMATTRLHRVAKPPRLRVRTVFRTYSKPAFVALGVLTATYNFAFFVVLGYAPVVLHLPVVPLGLVFTGWGIGLAFGILVVGHRLAHRIGAVQTVGAAVVVLALALVGLATSHSTAVSVLVLLVAGVCMGICNANLTDLSLATGGDDRRATTGAFNLIRWGFAAPAPVIAGLLAEHVGSTAPFWVTVVVLGVGLVVFAACSHILAPAVGERVLWARWDDEARALEAAPAEALAEV